MTVKELIEELKAYNPNAIVKIEETGNTFRDIERVDADVDDSNEGLFPVVLF